MMTDQKELPLEIEEMRQAIQAMPQSIFSQGGDATRLRRLENALDGIVRAHNRKHKILTMVKDTLGQLRLDMKYLVFDLEATRRERDELKEGK